MSRAFVKDDSDGPEPRLQRPVSTLPNYVTPRGLKLLRESLARAQADGDMRETAYLAERVDSAIVIDPSAHPQGVVEFGASVRAHDAAGHELSVRIVGEDEADPRDHQLGIPDCPCPDRPPGRRAGGRGTAGRSDRVHDRRDPLRVTVCKDTARLRASSWGAARRVLL